MDREFFKKLLSVPTYSKHEDRMIDFILEYATSKNIPTKIDDFGNIYLLKGVDDENIEYLPCVVSHVDTVHYKHVDLIHNNGFLDIHEIAKDNNTYLFATMDDSNGDEIQTGVGGDDKAGIAICLEIINRTDNIIGAFFRQEENGCHGSKASDAEVMSKVGYAIQFDAPGDNWVSENCYGVKLYNDEFLGEIKDILDKYNQTKYSHDPYTDVYALKKGYDFNTINFFAGYHNMHTDKEYIVIEQVEKAIEMGCEVIQKLGNKKMVYEYTGFNFRY